LRPPWLCLAGPKPGQSNLAGLLRIFRILTYFVRGLRNFAQPGAWVPLSQHEALRMKQSSGGTGAPAGALSCADGPALLERPASIELGQPDVATAGIDTVNDGPAYSGAVRFDVTPALWRGGFRAAHRHSARVRWFRRAAIAGSLLAITLISV